MSCRPRKTHDCQNGCTHTRMTIGGPTLGESQSPRDFRGPTIYRLDEAKTREWIALWRNSRPLSAIARWGNRGDKDPWWQDTSAFAATTLVQPDRKKLWNENTYSAPHCKWEWARSKFLRCIRHRVQKKCQGQWEEEGERLRKLSFMPDDMCTTRNF